jgi:hypothetical protein
MLIAKVGARVSKSLVAHSIEGSRVHLIFTSYCQIIVALCPLILLQIKAGVLPGTCCGVLKLAIHILLKKDLIKWCFASANGDGTRDLR